MIIERTYPKSMEDLLSAIARHADGAESVAVQAGHFLVYYDHTEDQLLPCVREELKSPRHAVITNSVGVFPFLTWQLGLDILRSTSARRKSILTVVNDWQYLPDHVDRARFYARHDKLFPSYADALAKQADVGLLTQRELGFKVKTGIWFSEVSLRNQYKRQVSKMLKAGSLPASAQFSENGDTVSCSLVDAVGRHQEIYCTGKRPTCTQEIAELVRQVCVQGQFSLLINLYPLVCKQYVQAGTELCADLIGPGSCRVLNIGMLSSNVTRTPDILAHAEMTFHARTGTPKQQAAAISSD